MATDEAGARFLAERATHAPRAAIVWRACGPQERIRREAPEETAIAISIDGRPHTVLMATPDDIADLVLGFSTTEAIAGVDEVEEIRIEAAADGIMADLRLRSGARRRPVRPRGLEGRSSCGLCGVQRLEDALRRPPPVRSTAKFAAQTVHAAVAMLADRQVLGAKTRATHAAAFFDGGGRLLALREDVGRHNALDKVGGAILRQGVDAAAGFVVVTSRCSFEMVDKTARLGAPMLVAISAPTNLAIDRAQDAGLTLAALARSDGFAVFTHPERLGLTAAAVEEDLAHV